MRDRASRPVPYRPGEVLLALYRRRGAVINAGVGGLGYTFLLGPRANQFVFANAEAFSWSETFQTLEPADGPNALMVSDGADHRRRRAAVAPALRHRQLSDYVPIIAANADAVIATWQPGRRVDIHTALRSAVRRSVAECLFGTRLAAQADFLGEQLEPLLALTHLPPQVMTVQRLLRTPGWRRAMAARGRINTLIDTQIGEARHHPRADDNLLTSLVDGHDRAVSQDEIRDLVVSLIADGYETTSGALAWAIYALLTVPGVWDSAAAEVSRILDDRVPTAEDLPSLTYLHGVVQETLRLYTPGVISARKVKHDVEFDGHRIRAGRMLVFSPYVTHRLPGVWTRPNEFRPERWEPTSSEFRRPSPYEFIPFSGGLHRCVGSALAVAEMTVMLARLLATTTLTLPAQRIRARHFGALRPWPGLTVDVGSRPKIDSPFG